MSLVQLSLYKDIPENRRHVPSSVPHTEYLSRHVNISTLTIFPCITICLKEYPCSPALTPYLGQQPTSTTPTTGKVPSARQSSDKCLINF